MKIRSQFSGSSACKFSINIIRTETATKLTLLWYNYHQVSITATQNSRRCKLLNWQTVLIIIVTWGDETGPEMVCNVFTNNQHQIMVRVMKTAIFYTNLSLCHYPSAGLTCVMN